MSAPEHEVIGGGSWTQRIYGGYRSSRALPGTVKARADAKVFDRRYDRFLPADPGARIVEIGCGDGSFLAYLRARGFCSVEGVDVSPEQVAAARGAGRPEVVLSDNADRLRRFEDELDLIVALDVIEHYTKPRLLDLLAAVHTALRPGGVFLVQTPNADGPFGARHRYSDFTHELAFTPSSLTQVLRLAGFRRIECVPVEPVVHGPASLARWCAWKLIRAALVASLAVETGCLRGHILTMNMIGAAWK